jgi:hypothetical protein
MHVNCKGFFHQFAQNRHAVSIYLELTKLCLGHAWLFSCVGNCGRDCFRNLGRCLAAFHHDEIMGTGSMLAAAVPAGLALVAL